MLQGQYGKCVSGLVWEGFVFRQQVCWWALSPLRDYLSHADCNSIDRLPAFTFGKISYNFYYLWFLSEQELYQREEKRPPLTVFVVMETYTVYGNEDTTTPINLVKN